MTDKPPVTTEEFVEAMSKLLASRSLEMITDLLEPNAIMEDMLHILGPLKPTPWYKRWAMRVGNWFIHIGIRLGGDYDY